MTGKPSPSWTFTTNRLEHSINSDQLPYKVLFDLLKHIVKS
jgi:hypothetical protein